LKIDPSSQNVLPGRTGMHEKRISAAVLTQVNILRGEALGASQKCARIPPSRAGGMNGLPSPPGERVRVRGK